MIWILSAITALLLLFLVMVYRTIYLRSGGTPLRVPSLGDTDSSTEPLESKGSRDSIGSAETEAQPQGLPQDFTPGYLDRFSAAIRIPTVTPPDQGATEAQLGELFRFQEFVQTSYPALCRVAEFTSLDAFGFYLRWPAAPQSSGHRAGGEKKPVLLMAHYDVVPVDAEKWSDPPFSGGVRDGYVHGRGSLDTKNTLIALLEAGEYLASQGFSPQRDIFFAFGGDEERNGIRGAMRLAEHFKSQNLKFAWASDEGMVVARGTLKGVATPLILLGTDEKGYVNLELSVSQNPGHSSRPPRNQAIARLGHTLSLLEKNPFPYQLIPSVRHFFEGLVPHAPFGLGMIFANLWITKPLLFLAMRMNPEGVSMLRTTLAMTMLQGSKAENILPDSARAIINLRLLPGWSAEKALNRIRKAIADPQIKVSFQANALHSDPVIGHGTGDEGYTMVARAAAAAFPGLPVLPCLVTAQTDSRHYADICESIVRFAPMELGKDELGLIHGHDERISIENFESGIRFYLHLLGSMEATNHGK